VTVADPELPLAHLRVLEIATEIAGPYAGKLFADAGADVVKVEPPASDPIRRHTAGGPLADVLRGARPARVIVAITPFGLSGPTARATEVPLQARSCTPRSRSCRCRGDRLRPRAARWRLVGGPCRGSLPNNQRLTINQHARVGFRVPLTSPLSSGDDEFLGSLESGQRRCRGLSTGREARLKPIESTPPWAAGNGSFS
jgi:CoA-transferase family III